MNNVMLSNIPTTALQQWLDAHFYYLPEIPRETLADWSLTMLTLMEQLEKRRIKTSLKFEAKE
jgi:hypothetical protein